MGKLKIKVGQVLKTERYYLFWGIISAAVVLGQLYVGLGYRIMAESIFEAIDKYEINRADPIHRPRPLN